MTPAIGYAIREQNRLILGDPAINAAEITFERADDPLRIDRYVGDQDFDTVGCQHLERTRKRRHRKRVGIHPEKQWTICVLQFSIQTNCLRDGEDMPLVKSLL